MRRTTSVIRGAGRAAAAALAAAAAASLVACGGATTAAQPLSAPQSKTERDWIDNASRLIDDLDQNVLLSANGGADLESARRALRNDSDLYVMIVAYTFFGGCGQTLVNAGSPSRRLLPAARTLASACRRLERSSTLFTRATTRSDPGALLAASRIALRTSPLLSRARAELRFARNAAR
jgi:hypothetical protein